MAGQVFQNKLMRKETSAFTEHVRGTILLVQDTFPLSFREEMNHQSKQ